MQIIFEPGDAGLNEVQELQRLIASLAQHAELRDVSSGIIEKISWQCAARLEGNAPPGLGSVVKGGATGAPAGPASEGFWSRLFGPSRREKTLAEQRVAALERAERAERSSFESLAEMAQVARERDTALSRITELEASLRDPKVD